MESVGNKSKIEILVEGTDTEKEDVIDQLSIDEVKATRGERPDNTLRRRYAVRQDEEGRYLTCVEAPNVAVRIERGLSVSATSAKKAPSGTIYLDGAAACEPFMDVQRRVYNLDHHEGCVRPFTLSTCEQAVVLAFKGLDLRSGEWTVWANEPDLDTILAIWVLLNHMRVSEENSDVRAAIMPLLRLEGAIDANGLRFTEICGFPREHLEKTKSILDDLYSFEREVKGDGKWPTIDFLEYTAEVLRSIDALYYSPLLFEETPDIDEMHRVPIGTNRMAVVCRAETGIYEVEKGLAKLHGNSVGLIILQKNFKTYTVRQVDPFLPIPLEALYDRLNLTDPAAEAGGEGNRWGGSAEIGGSPRKTGTRLTPNEIARVCDWVYHPPTPLKRLGAAAGVSWAVIGTMALALFGAFIYSEQLTQLNFLTLISQTTSGLYTAISLMVALTLILVFGARHRRQFGLRLPTGWNWLLLSPAAIVTGILGGAWVAPPPLLGGGSALLSALLLPLVSELLHRGVVHGTLVVYWKVQRPNGPWFLSWPTAISGALSALLSSGLFLPALLYHPQGPSPWLAPAWITGSLLLGVACGVTRERSGSILPPLLFHVVAALWLVLLPSIF